ncbi:hypothetical protein [Acinetobacter baylyi]|nr:hypothetical protein [Acinetobacter baylyi]MAK30432.1 hypothetical protein [Acinetobacter sp.]ENV53922.1 hypothetical protein F952_01975 [Acinetobacter baylyi DSM 14961 = CIP 107474]KAF2373388.1 hypothetical protein BSL88_00295 [Acinetobacter baylyi]KAF2374472.1 hypothetical protein BSL67_07625 [Acinetobacter baylyi]KAF2377157.1 hypothetical protein BSN81_09840 [Acinetobacter baylyi]
MNTHNLTEFDEQYNFQDHEYERTAEERAEDRYGDAIDHYRETRNALEQALGVQKDFEQTSWSAAEAVEDLQRNHDQYRLIQRFEDAVIKKMKAKGEL